MTHTIHEWLQAYVHPSLHAQALADLAALYASDTPTAGTGSESTVQAATVRLSGQHRQRLWRNNSGAAVDDQGRQIRYGLGNTSKRINAVMKSSDYIGITTITVQPHHVGQRLGVFTALEFKKPGWTLTAGDKRGQAQAAFGQIVIGAGGIFSFISDPGQYVELLRRWGALQTAGHDDH